VAYAQQVFFPGTCPFTFLRRAMNPAIVSDPVLPHLLPEGNDEPPAEAVIFALRRIEAALDAQSVCGSNKPCIPFPSARHKRYRLLTVAETRLKLVRIETFSELDPGWAKAAADELYRETRKEARTRKEAPILKRLTGLVRKIVSDHDGAWTTLPSLDSIATTLSVSRRTVQLALNRLRETSGEFAFHTEPRLDTTCADRRGRCVRVALTSWLKHDQKTLLFDLEGKERGIRTSFRPEGEVRTPGPLTKATEPLTDKTKEKETREPAEVSPGPDSVSGPAPVQSATKCKFCLSYSVRLDEPAVLTPNLSRPAHLQFLEYQKPASPELKSDRSALKTQTRLAWGLARELRQTHFGDWNDDPLTYHRWRFDLPVNVIQNMISEALGAGKSASKLKNVFESACYETNAAVFDGLAQNPGGLFRAVFRRRWRAQKQEEPVWVN
jgi:hypothetical protein